VEGIYSNHKTEFNKKQEKFERLKKKKNRKKESN
jgi:hypothetical protein